MSKNEMNGVDELLDKLQNLADAAPNIAAAGVCAAAGTMANGIKNRAPAPLRDYIGWRLIRSAGTKIRAVVGLGYGPKSRKSTRRTPPTPAQTQHLQQIIQSGVSTSTPSAVAAMNKSTSKRIQAILDD